MNGNPWRGAVGFCDRVDTRSYKRDGMQRPVVRVHAGGGGSFSQRHFTAFDPGVEIRLSGRERTGGKM